MVQDIAEMNLTGKLSGILIPRYIGASLSWQWRWKDVVQIKLRVQRIQPYGSQVEAQTVLG